jgi:superoxide reductase
MMTEKLQIYKCEVCGNVVEVIHAGAGELVCCGQPMKLFKENTTDAATEKHVPAIEKLEKGIKAKVGEVAHPMKEDHYIEWIEVIFPTGRANRQFLEPGQTPEAEFPCAEGKVIVREYCNIHGLWKAEG